MAPLLVSSQYSLFVSFSFRNVFSHVPGTVVLVLHSFLEVKGDCIDSIDTLSKDLEFLMAAEVQGFLVSSPLFYFCIDSLSCFHSKHIDSCVFSYLLRSECTESAQDQPGPLQ